MYAIHYFKDGGVADVFVVETRADAMADALEIINQTSGLYMQVYHDASGVSIMINDDLTQEAWDSLPWHSVLIEDAGPDSLYQALYMDE